MRLLLVAPRAELLPLRPLRVLPPVLGREIVPTLTDGALHDDVLARHVSPQPSAVGRQHGWLTADGRWLLFDFRDDPRTHGAAPLTDREPQLLLHGDRRDQLDRHLRAVPRHHYLHPRRLLHLPRPLRRPEVEPRPIALEIPPAPT